MGKALKAIEKAAENEGKVQAYLQASTLENIQALEKLTEVVASGETDFSKLTDSQRRSVAILRLLPTMADDADKVLKEAQRPRVAPLMLSLEQQRLALEAIRRSRSCRTGRSLHTGRRWTSPGRNTTPSAARATCWRRTTPRRACRWTSHWPP